jgi:hypothetical protein
MAERDSPASVRSTWGMTMIISMAKIAWQVCGGCMAAWADSTPRACALQNACHGAVRNGPRHKHKAGCLSTVSFARLLRRQKHLDPFSICPA